MAEGKQCGLLTMFLLTSVLFVLEVTVGHTTRSTTLIADSFHMLTDMAALSVSFLSQRISPLKWSQNTFGWARAEVLGALVNAVFLAAMCFTLLIEAIKRFIEVEEIREPKLVVIIGSLGLLVNLLGLLIFKKHRPRIHPPRAMLEEQEMVLRTVVEGKEDEVQKGQKVAFKKDDELNMRSVFLHVLFDAMGSCIVVLSALVVWLTDWSLKHYLDPSLTLLMVCLVLKTVWPLLRDSSLVLLQTVPLHIEVEGLKKRLTEGVDGVLGVHELHIWRLTGDRIIASAHISCRNLPEYMQLAGRVKEFFHNEGIHSTTVQPEFLELTDAAGERDCALDCPDPPICAVNTCCGSPAPKAPQAYKRNPYMDGDS